VANRGAPIGNRNGAKGKAWDDALRKALVQYQADGVPQGQALAKIADKVVSLALAGDKDAWKEIGDRLDGKPSQSIDQNITHRVEESISEEHARLVAEGYLESLRRHQGNGSKELGSVHGGHAAGLPSGEPAPQDSGRT